jgi:hypothetical protein
LNRLLLLAFLVAASIAFLSLRNRKVKFEVEFELEPQAEGGEDDTEEDD